MCGGWLAACPRVRVSAWARSRMHSPDRIVRFSIIVQPHPHRVSLSRGFWCATERSCLERRRFIDMDTRAGNQLCDQSTQISPQLSCMLYGCSFESLHHIYRTGECVPSMHELTVEEHMLCVCVCVKCRIDVDTHTLAYTSPFAKQFV